jgi:hypothetical protein
VLGIFKIGSAELFAQAAFELKSSWSLPPEMLQLQAWATCSWLQVKLFNRILSSALCLFLLHFDFPCLFKNSCLFTLFWWDWGLNSRLSTCKNRCCTAWVTTPVHFVLVILEMRVTLNNYPPDPSLPSNEDNRREPSVPGSHAFWDFIYSTNIIYYVPDIGVGAKNKTALLKL